jgi:presequence protease
MKRLKKISAALAIVFSLGLFLNPALTVSAEENVTTINEQVTKDFKVGQVYHGFKLVEEKELKDYDAIGRIFEHVKSGARLVQFKNNDPNKYFAVTFRTPTNDNKGKPHVLEHSVLFGGSEKYPVKQLLNYLVNASLVNEINGYTYPDKTQYPFATVNEEEFNNLMDVYLDMTYNSRVTSCENIFKEEAWHHEITDAKSPIVDTGVVFNEMKGAMSSTSSVLQTAIFRSLLPDTTYNFVSGGDPKYIPELTYNELVDYYKKYYHPSNSFIFIYGDTTIDDKLKNIDDNFLSKVSKKQVDSKIKKQKPFNETKLYEAEYGISKEQPAENQDYISLNFVTGDAADFDQIVGIQVLTQLVLNNENSLLHENLKAAGFQNISASFIAQQAQTILSITASNTDRKRKDEFKKIVMDSLKQTVKDGIDKGLLESVINSYELSDKLSKSYNSSTAKIFYALTSMGFVYDSDMLSIFESNDKIMDTLKDATKTDYFEKLLQDKLINNKFSSLVVLKAVTGLNDTEKETEIKKLADYKASLSKEELDKLIKGNIELKNWQSTIESPEILSKIPMLNVDNLTPKLEKTPLEIKRIDGVKVLYHPMYTNGTNNIIIL